MSFLTFSKVKRRFFFIEWCANVGPVSLQHLCCRLTVDMVVVGCGDSLNKVQV